MRTQDERNADTRSILRGAQVQYLKAMENALDAERALKIAQVQADAWLDLIVDAKAQLEAAS